MRANSKQVKSKILDHIINEFEQLDYEGCTTNNQKIKSQINYMKCKHETILETCRRLVEGGTFLISYKDMRDFINTLELNNKNKKDFNDTQVLNMYVYLLSKELEKNYLSKM